MMSLITIPKERSVLVVEDNADRIAWFKHKLEPMSYSVVYAWTVQKALNVLGAHRFDIVFLDHDAVPFFVEDTDPENDQKTFRRVAKLLADTKYEGTVVIHSHNPVGARQMAHWLGRNAQVTVCPFGMFNIQII